RPAPDAGTGSSPALPAPALPSPGTADPGVAAPLPPRRGTAGDAQTPGTAAQVSGVARVAVARPPLPLPARLPQTSPGPQPDQFICRDPRLAGAAMPAIGDHGAPCGITDPVRLTAVSGVGFDTPATLDCPTARRVAHWLTGVAEPLARQHFGSPIVEVDVMGSYACRTRNNQSGGRVSEHGRGRAIDVGGFRLADGRQISVKADWGRGPGGAFLNALHRQSCGLFMTVLGPGADRHHHDHFHLDTARRNGTTYCR
ncbi:MAG: extensin family protein, partial [Thermohalobaculum sp.]|nr:extensin family protein [Thermohalobaculum sp.]